MIEGSNWESPTNDFRDFFFKWWYEKTLVVKGIYI